MVVCDLDFRFPFRLDLNFGMRKPRGKWEVMTDHPTFNSTHFSALVYRVEQSAGYEEELQYVRYVPYVRGGVQG